MRFTKILIANRGEIACRVMRTARALGYRTVAVYSDADAAAPHVAQADESVRLGPAPAAQSYLSIPALLAAARATGADAVHPGYGFLSERAEFAQACADAGLVFIGPPPSAITAMGDKARAKRRMLAAGVPCVPGYMGDEARAPSDAELTAAAQELGVPLLVKAVAGGGGRGMRLVHDLGALPEALAGARREAENAFGDGTLMLERLIEHGRHVEVQVFGDHHGHAIHLGERDCTAQRRRQKVIEEAPSPIVGPDQRARMGADAVSAAQAVGYVGAGTVEFIVDGEGRHYFLEMNTRLQVEHPVTECITGLDLVEWQLRVAAGEPLPLTQDQVRFSGHAIEVRLCTEDPHDGFRPHTGRILHWRPEDAAAAGIRIDHGIAEGGEVTPWYDNMVAKVIAHGRDRADAIRRLRAALAAAPLLGVANNGPWLRALLASDAFGQARMTTRMLDDWAVQQPPPLPAAAPTDTDWALAAAVIAQRRGFGWRPASVAAWNLPLECGGRRRVARVRPLAAGSVDVTLDGDLHPVRTLRIDGHRAAAQLGGRALQVLARFDGNALFLVRDGEPHRFDEFQPWQAAERKVDPGVARSPVAGTVARVAVTAGQAVEAGTPLVCVEAMKIEMWQHARAAGTVRAVHVAERDTVGAGALLVELDVAAG